MKLWGGSCASRFEFEVGTQLRLWVKLAFLNIDDGSDMLSVEGSSQHPRFEAIDDLQSANMFGMKHVLKNYPFDNKIPPDPFLITLEP